MPGVLNDILIVSSFSPWTVTGS